MVSSGTALALCVYLCKIDGFATKASGTHFIECLYRPPVTRVGVGETADRARANYYYCCRMSALPYLFVTKGVEGGKGSSTETQLSPPTSTIVRLIKYTPRHDSK